MKCPKCNRSICECPEQPEGYELRRFDDLGGEPAPSPTQGERPAEARADHEAATEFAEHHRYGRGEAVENLAAAYLELLSSPQAGAPIPMVLHCPRCRTQHIDKPQPEKGWDNPPHRSHECQACGFIWRPADIATTGVEAIKTRGKHDSSPQEGATAVGADELVTRLRQFAERRDVGHAVVSGLREAAALIEALQGRVEEWKDACQAYSNTVTRLNERAEAAEASLRTLGDALERAREALGQAGRWFREYEAHHLAKNPPDTDRGWRNCERAAFCEDAAAVLTPPTRDTSREAVAKQEPATCPECIVDPGSPHDLHYLPSRAREIPATTDICPNCDTALPVGCGGIFEDQPECRRATSDKGADE